jgi:hypothetical protein
VGQLLQSLRPDAVRNVYDLVSAAGVNVAHWAVRRTDGGRVANPAGNSDYSFRWGFLQPKKVAAVCLWWERMVENESGVYYPFNVKKRVARAIEEGDSHAERRALELASVFDSARIDNIPLRAIVIEGKDKGRKKRKLDEAPWRVESFDEGSGEYLLRRVGPSDDPLSASNIYALVLAENEGTAGDFDWHDVTGERYQFPKNYQNIIRPGMPFVYYSGTRDAAGNRKPAHYFGSGLIGDVYPDSTTTHLPKGQWKWLADIVNFVPFSANVPMRDSDGNYLELGAPQVPAKNYWGIGVRAIDKAKYDAIIALGAQSSKPGLLPVSEVAGALSESPEELLQARPPRTEADVRNTKTFNTRRSGQAKVTGDAAEKLFFEYLCSLEPDPAKREEIVWVARDGETPGFDIEDRRNKNQPIAYEIKGTVGSAFPSFEFTENEMRAAKALGERYVIVLVTGCLGNAPVFERIANPAALFGTGVLEAMPSVYRIEKRRDGAQKL